MFLSVCGCGRKAAPKAQEPAAPAKSSAPAVIAAKPEPKPEPKVYDVSICCAGDIMAHMSQVNSAQGSDGTFDFYGDYVYVERYFKGADLAMANFECTFPGDGKYTGYPAFRSPDDIARDTAAAGVDVAIFANNHMLDSGLSGAKRTVEILRENGMPVAGCRADTSEDRYVVYTMENGLKAGVVAYTYETSMSSGKRTINGAYMNSEAPDYINSFRYDSGYMDADIDAIGEQMKLCREAGADIVIAYMHWGEEYQRTPNSYQKKIAQKLADMGADVVFASHPHVLQGIEILTAEGGDGERKVPVFYSIGNFISNQRYETLKNRYTEQGMIGFIDFTVTEDPETGAKKIGEFSASCVPTWVERYNKNGKTDYAIIPLDSDLENNPDLLASGHLDRARQALADVTELVGEDFIRK